MTTQDFITYLFCPVDDKLNKANKNHKHSQANLYPSDSLPYTFWLSAGSQLLCGLLRLANPHLTDTIPSKCGICLFNVAVKCGFGDAYHLANFFDGVHCLTLKLTECNSGEASRLGLVRCGGISGINKSCVGLVSSNSLV